MANPVFAEDDDGFYGYVETTHDPGYSLLFATILFCVISYCSLPCLVSLGNRLDVKNNKSGKKRSSNPQQHQRRSGPKKKKNVQGQFNQKKDSSINDEEDDQEEEEVLFYEASQMQDDNSTSIVVDPIFDATEGPPSPARSFASAKSTFSAAPSVSSFQSHRSRKRRQRKLRTMTKRHDFEEYELRMQRYDGDGNSQQQSSKRIIQRAPQPPSPQRHPSSTTTAKHHHHRDVSPERSVLAPLDADAVSMDDAVSTAARNTIHHPSHLHGVEDNSNPGGPPGRNPNSFQPLPTKDGGIIYDNPHDQGSYQYHNFYCLNSFWDTLMDLVTWDFESKRIIKLAIPFATQAFSTGLLDSVTVAVIGKVLGTKEVSAFVIVRTLIDISSSFFGGFHESIATLCSQALGHHNNKLVGQYCQLSVVFYVICYIPFMFLWSIYMTPLLLWLGFDEETATIGNEYTKVYLFLELLDGVDESIHGLLDVAGLESYSTLVGVSHELVTFLDILVVTMIAKPSLMVIGLIELLVSIIFIGINVGYIRYRGWFQPYQEGLIGSCALYNNQAVKAMLGTASSLALGYLLTDGEWEILTLFASFLGPAEVAAWGILGVLWDAIEQLTEAVADASEVRCAFLLGSGQPEKAKRSAYKSIFMGVFLSLFLTSLVFMAGNDLATWFTNDPALQHIIRDLIPLFGIGNITLTMGTMCWTLLGSQGRYRLATFVAFMASWFVTLPLAALFNFELKINLQGQTAAIVIGYMVSGTINAYFLFRSDWEALSKSVMKTNGAEVAPPPDLAIDNDRVGDKTASKDILFDDLELLPNPTLGTLGTLMEARSGDESFTSSSSTGGLSPASSKETELV